MGNDLSDTKNAGLLPSEAIKNLTECQKQLDRDGCMVGVSRQALDEVLTYVNTRAQPDAGAAVGDISSVISFVKSCGYGGSEYKKALQKLYSAALKSPSKPSGDDAENGWVAIPTDAGDRLGEDFLRACFNGMTPFTTVINGILKSAAERFPEKQSAALKAAPERGVDAVRDIKAAIEFEEIERGAGTTIHILLTRALALLAAKDGGG